MPEQTQKTTIDFLLDILRELHQQYTKYPAGRKIRYEVYLGEDDGEEEEDINDYHSRLDALNQLKEEGVVLDYVIASKTEDFMHHEFAGTRIEYKIAKCLIDKSRFLKHIEENDHLREAERVLRDNSVKEQGKINQQIWETLQDIQEEFLVTEKEKPVKYQFGNVIGGGAIPADRRRKILRKLQEKGAFEIQHYPDGRRIGRSELFYLIINPIKFQEIYNEYYQINNVEEDSDDEEDDVFSYDGGVSSPYENTDLELFILKKILLEHKRRDDSGFFAKELSINNNSLEEICKVINKLMEDKILYLSANTRPEGTEGIEDKSGFINWNLVENLSKSPNLMDAENGSVIFDTEILDEIRLKGRIDIATDEFMNDKVYIPLGLMMDKNEVEKIMEGVAQETNMEKKSVFEEALKPQKITYPYYKQREIIIDEISKDNKQVLEIPLNNFRDGQVDVLKTLLALEKENLLRITALISNSIYDDKNNFTGQWSKQDNPVARIYTLKTQTNKQEPMLMKIVGMPELQIKGLEEKIVLPKPKNKKIQLRKFPADLRWEEISIQFLNDQEVIIKARGDTHQTTYEAMGFQDERRKLPNKQWQFLQLLARKNGEVSWDSNQGLSLKQINSIKKQKQLLSEAIKAYFQIYESEPFYDYKTEKAYRIKLILTPETAE